MGPGSGIKVQHMQYTGKTLGTQIQEWRNETSVIKCPEFYIKHMHRMVSMANP